MPRLHRRLRRHQDISSVLNVRTVNSVDAFRQTALHVAAHHGSQRNVALLLDTGAESSLRDVNGWTPLHSAAAAGRFQVCTLLLRRCGAHCAPQWCTRDGNNFLHYIARHRVGSDRRRLARLWELLELCRAAIPSSVRSSPTLDDSQQSSDWELPSEALLMLNAHGHTPLHQASLCGNTSLVAWLLRVGVSPHVIAPDGDTPLHCAVRAAHHGVARLLVEAGAIVTATPSTAYFLTASTTTIPPDTTTALPITTATAALPITTATAALPITTATTALPVTTATTALPITTATAALPITTATAALTTRTTATPRTVPNTSARPIAIASPTPAIVVPSTSRPETESVQQLASALDFPLRRIVAQRASDSRPLTLCFEVLRLKHLPAQLIDSRSPGRVCLSLLIDEPAPKAAGRAAEAGPMPWRHRTRSLRVGGRLRWRSERGRLRAEHRPLTLLRAPRLALRLSHSSVDRSETCVARTLIECGQLSLEDGPAVHWFSLSPEVNVAHARKPVVRLRLWYQRADGTTLDLPGLRRPSRPLVRLGQESTRRYWSMVQLDMQQRREQRSPEKTTRRANSEDELHDYTATGELSTASNSDSECSLQLDSSNLDDSDTTCTEDYDALMSGGGSVRSSSPRDPTETEQQTPLSSRPTAHCPAELSGRADSSRSRLPDGDSPNSSLGDLTIDEQLLPIDRGGRASRRRKRRACAAAARAAAEVNPLSALSRSAHTQSSSDSDRHAALALFSSAPPSLLAARGGQFGGALRSRERGGQQFGSAQRCRDRGAAECRAARRRAQLTSTSTSTSTSMSTSGSSSEVEVTPPSSPTQRLRVPAPRRVATTLLSSLRRAARSFSRPHPHPPSAPSDSSLSSGTDLSPRTETLRGADRRRRSEVRAHCTSDAESDEAALGSASSSCSVSAAVQCTSSSDSLRSAQSQREMSPPRSACRERRWSIDLSEFTFDRRVAEGRTTKVYKGVWNGKPVAVKLLKRCLSRAQLRALEREVERRARLQHPHVVRSVGACVSDSVYLIEEYCALGTLQRLLQREEVEQQRHSQSPLLDWERALHMAAGLTSGLAYLCSNDGVGVVGELSSHSVLVDADLSLKLGYCTSSTVAYLRLAGECGNESSSDCSSSGGGAPSVSGRTCAYSAPEVIAGQPPSEASLVFSASLVLWELLSSVLRGKYEPPNEQPRPRLPADMPAAVAHLLTACWAADPYCRPSIPELDEHLQELINWPVV
eukprot:CAMPEP_0177666876 /NCGR_PEP_ID=MMETSP0447-20121125/21818_1 /TAXON_ID=0 /ORGANISM="Stygamoeba regulata, Strain BSH-02190019" /LENGTH=1228 /DNA_ID=CAMNT_0019173059 /DNA_START=276 /DNA_END=3962 /DNA_ORIENTATION=-